MNITPFWSQWNAWIHNFATMLHLHPSPARCLMQRRDFNWLSWLLFLFSSVHFNCSPINFNMVLLLLISQNFSKDTPKLYLFASHQRLLGTARLLMAINLETAPATKYDTNLFFLARLNLRLSARLVLRQQCCRQMQISLYEIKCMFLSRWINVHK